MLEPIKVLCDIDGVLADFILAWTTTACDLGFIKEPTKTINQQVWSEAGGSDMTEKQIRQVWSVVDFSQWFWLDKVRPIPTRDELFDLAKLADQLEVYFVTSRFGGRPTVQYQTWLWLRSLGFYRPNVITTHQKPRFCKAIGITHSLEDKATNANALDQTGVKSYLVDRPFNQNGRNKNLIVVKNLQQFIDAVRKDNECLNGQKLKWF